MHSCHSAQMMMDSVARQRTLIYPPLFVTAPLSLSKKQSSSWSSCVAGSIHTLCRWSSRIVLKCRDECCDEKVPRYENRVERGFEFKCVFKSRLDVRAGCPHQCCSEQGTYECRQRQIHHAVDANHTVEVWKTTNSYNESRQGEYRSNCGNWRNAI